ncbi:unnamed protein product (macronuclear) [Paramecium tetraurelia]|uniref:Transmembrane protein n=1 Tax=Paramecium tetraurelia TaxID=5888 RepID=A0D144_PARTE|nr:uncharacterized protein GSPATT00039176001 [Paramecium tetraurelia]CAK76761.1 unnamed protein product [Paramecium tetraurelia]|eukprot:XP_001444158.1 hypothetical protein (macronuclear) [Paramecium tetraurelia strain d4-2]
MGIGCKAAVYSYSNCSTSYLFDSCCHSQSNFKNHILFQNYYLLSHCTIQILNFATYSINAYTFIWALNRSFSDHIAKYLILFDIFSIVNLLIKNCNQAFLLIMLRTVFLSSIMFCVSAVHHQFLQHAMNFVYFLIQHSQSLIKVLNFFDNYSIQKEQSSIQADNESRETNAIKKILMDLHHVCLKINAVHIGFKLKIWQTKAGTSLSHYIIIILVSCTIKQKFIFLISL